MSTPERAGTHGFASRILLVDDEEANLRLLTVLLKREGYSNVVATPDPVEAVHLLDSLRPDLVLLDLHMPGMDGFTVLAEIRRRVGPGEHVPVLVLTGDTSSEAKLRALSGGASDLLAKPFDPVEVMLRVERLLETRALHHALQRQNAELEGRVAERTRELNHALRRAEVAAQAKAQFLAKMSHELRTPLNAILGALEVVRTLPASTLPELAQRMVDLAGRNVEHMTGVINEILYLQSVEQGAVHPESYPVHVGPLLMELAERAQSRARAQGLDIHLDVPPGLRPITGDAVRLSDLLWRLLDNALRFTPHGEIRLRVVADPHTQVPVRIDVADTGTGIPPERLEAIFHPFEQADNSATRRYEGTGIGLALSRALCDLLGYSLRVDSQPGRGTTFSVVL